jgi:hypothetical protein
MRRELNGINGLYRTHRPPPWRPKMPDLQAHYNRTHAPSDPPFHGPECVAHHGPNRPNSGPHHASDSPHSPATTLGERIWMTSASAITHSIKILDGEEPSTIRRYGDLLSGVPACV